MTKLCTNVPSNHLKPEMYDSVSFSLIQIRYYPSLGTFESKGKIVQAYCPDPKPYTGLAIIDIIADVFD